MKPLNISIRAIGPGSQPSGDEELQCVPMPRDVTRRASALQSKPPARAMRRPAP